MINMIYYVSRRGIRTVMGIILLWYQFGLSIPICPLPEYTILFLH